MKKLKFQLWWISIPIIAFFCGMQKVFDYGEQGRLDHPLLREEIYPYVRSLNGGLTNLKFKIRGPITPKNKIVVLAADDASLLSLGRWPWPREYYAMIFHTLFKHQIKILGIDVVFSEPEHTLPEEMVSAVGKKDPALEASIRETFGDPKMAEVFRAYADRIVLGYTENGTCQPRYLKGEDCPIDNQEAEQIVIDENGKFASPFPHSLSDSVIQESPLLYMLQGVFNIPLFRDVAKHAGFFSANLDPDGYIRRYGVMFMTRKHWYPSLALSMAQIIKDDQFKIEFTEDGRVSRAYFEKTPEDSIPTTPMGFVDLNFRGPREIFETISVTEVLESLEKPNPELEESLKDAYVLFGPTAVGIFDMRAFPFDSNTPGVEGHATALDNFLSNDFLRTPNALGLGNLPLLLLVIFGLLFGVYFSKYESIPSLAGFLAFMLILGGIDLFYLFPRNINIPTALLGLEILSLFTLILSIRYVLEEKNKKFIRAAFSHYLAPQVVDMVLKDPEKLTVGGERKDVTIMFSDLRGFTTISEKMDPKTLSQFLNEYLTEMTEIVFQYGGTLDKYIGDAIMAFWGAPIHSDQHALLACQAAIKMQEKIKEIAPRLKEKYGAEVSVGIGLNSGVVSVGNMGSQKIFEYTVIGDHVNLASRVEGLTRPYSTDIICTEYTMEALGACKNQVPHREIDSVKVKGKKNATILYEIQTNPISESQITVFQQARQAFLNRDWDLAIQKFKESDQISQKEKSQSDGVALSFVERANDFKETPPPEDWDGTLVMRSK